MQASPECVGYVALFSPHLAHPVPTYFLSLQSGRLSKKELTNSVLLRLGEETIIIASLKCMVLHSVRHTYLCTRMLPGTTVEAGGRWLVHGGTHLFNAFIKYNTSSSNP